MFMNVFERYSLNDTTYYNISMDVALCLDLKFPQAIFIYHECRDVYYVEVEECCEIFSYESV